MSVQTACDRCTKGVMDADNPHLHGLCECACHEHPKVVDLLAALEESVAAARAARTPADAAHRENAGPEGGGS